MEDEDILLSALRAAGTGNGSAAGADTIELPRFVGVLERLGVCPGNLRSIVDAAGLREPHVDLKKFFVAAEAVAHPPRRVGGVELPVVPSLVGTKEATKELDGLREEVEGLKDRMKQQSPQFSVGHYNILAGYMGNNREPWFLYGPQVSQERRDEIMRYYNMKDDAGKFVYDTWPKYVEGVLSAEEQEEVERVHREHFDWSARKGRILDTIREMCVDVLSLVECDHYEDHFKPGLEQLGYDSFWKRRPRASSKDGCCVAWKRREFDLVASTSIDYVDKFDRVKLTAVKDRVGLVVLLRLRSTGDLVCFVSTHLARNPEEEERDRLRSSQVGQLWHAIADFARAHDAWDAPVVVAGDLNSTSFGKLRGIVNSVMLLEGNTCAHPFVFDCADVPTNATSVTTARNVRIDAIMFQEQTLKLIEVRKLPWLTSADPIPNAEHPSDHVPVSACFRLRSDWEKKCRVARGWLLQLLGWNRTMTLDGDQLRSAFDLFDQDSEGILTVEKIHLAVPAVMGAHHVKEVAAALPKLSSEKLDFSGFAQAYSEALAAAGLPHKDDLRDAFSAFDRHRSNKLTLEDFRQIFEDCTPKALPESDVKALFAVIDKDGDGIIDPDEFVSHLSKVWTTKFTSRASIAGKGDAPGAA